MMKYFWIVCTAIFLGHVTYGKEKQSMPPLLDPAYLSQYIQQKSYSQEDKIFSSEWQKISIPDTYCGDGSAYSVFLRPAASQQREQSQEKLVIGFMGGGACWSTATCWGPTITAWIHPIPFMIPFQGIFSRDQQSSPVSQETFLFFPYCTGDMFLGRHTKNYFWGMANVYHVGYDNVIKTLKHLQEKKMISWSSLDEVLVHGSSAGALGALAHFLHIDSYLPLESKRSLIIDSPGLHFGKNFLEKFTPELQKDIESVLEEIQLSFDPKNESVSQKLRSFCLSYPKWNMFFLQGTQDIVMSLIFGNTTPWEHKKMVLSEDGLHEMTKHLDDRCVSWIPDTYYHTFLLQNETMKAGIEGHGQLKQFIEKGLSQEPSEEQRMNQTGEFHWKGQLY